VRERNNVTAPLKKKVQKLESEIIKLEESLEAHHKELVEVSNCGESAALIELSKLVSSQEAKVEELFETLEHAQSELDDINEEYEKKSLALEG